MNIHVRDLKPEEMKYALGTLMYCPGDNAKIADKLIENKLPDLNVLVLCLEDAILLQNLDHATDVLEETLIKLQKAVKENKNLKLPLLFIRIRNPNHLETSLKRFAKYRGILNGFVMPKYDHTVSEQYKKIINSMHYNKFKFMPIMESPVLIESPNRKKELIKIRDDLLTTRGIMGVLLGGNDLCNYFGIRRSSRQTIYDIGVIRDIITDVVCVFVKHFIINGAIWEYFDGDNWAEGLRAEAELDKLNGLFGKSCIHPKQLEVIREAVKVSAIDFEDAEDIVNWNREAGVSKGANSGRMNEVATHQAWAEKVYTIGRLYGVSGNVNGSDSNDLTHLEEI